VCLSIKFYRVASKAIFYLMVPYEFSKVVVCLFKVFEVARYTQ
jgi:hypothetical protein